MTVRVTGTVLDERGNGVPWVSISNGEFVVRTDARGRYEIEAEPGSHSFITVSAPDTHRTVGGFYRRVPMTNATVDFQLRSTPKRQYEEFTSGADHRYPRPHRAILPAAGGLAGA